MWGDWIWSQGLLLRNIKSLNNLGFSLQKRRNVQGTISMEHPWFNHLRKPCKTPLSSSREYCRKILRSTHRNILSPDYWNTVENSENTCNDLSVLISNYQMVSQKWDILVLTSITAPTPLCYAFFLSNIRRDSLKWACPYVHKWVADCTVVVLLIIMILFEKFTIQLIKYGFPIDIIFSQEILAI